jgi:hypothetical protein
MGLLRVYAGPCRCLLSCSKSTIYDYESPALTVELQALLSSMLVESDELIECTGWPARMAPSFALTFGESETHRRATPGSSTAFAAKCAAYSAPSKIALGSVAPTGLVGSLGVVPRTSSWADFFAPSGSRFGQSRFSSPLLAPKGPWKLTLTIRLRC